MGAIYLTDEQINQIKVLKVRGANAQGNYSDVYQAISAMLPDSKVKLWLDGAALANAGRGVFAELIRPYSQRQMELCGIQYTDAFMQEASNRVATKALADILTDTRRVGDNRWEFPTIEEIENKDVTGVR